MKSTDIVLVSMFQYEVVGARGLDGQITVKRTTHVPLQLPSSESQLQPSKKRQYKIALVLKTNPVQNAEVAFFIYCFHFYKKMGDAEGRSSQRHIGRRHKQNNGRPDRGSLT